ncbi:MAG TPA: hypothetical protein VIK10_03765 [Prolixibacteraceae bacterium]
MHTSSRILAERSHLSSLISPTRILLHELFPVFGSLEEAPLPVIACLMRRGAHSKVSKHAETQTAK